MCKILTVVGLVAVVMLVSMMSNVFPMRCIFLNPVDRCNCSSGAEGILDPDECDQNTGQCICLSGYTGLQCEDCEDGFFTNGTSGCMPCACDSFGAVNHLCDRSAVFCFLCGTHMLSVCRSIDSLPKCKAKVSS